MLELTMRDVIANAKPLIEARTLQVFAANKANNSYGLCSYAGPCVIGASVPTEIAKEWDSLNNNNGASLQQLVDNKDLKFPNQKETEDASNLQGVHDAALMNPRYQSEFLKLFATMEAKYGGTD